MFPGTLLQTGWRFTCKRQNGRQGKRKGKGGTGGFVPSERNNMKEANMNKKKKDFNGIGCRMFRSGYIEGPNGEVLEFGQCRPDLEKILPPGKCGVYATRVYFEMLRDLSILRKMIAESYAMMAMADAGWKNPSSLVPTLRYNHKMAGEVLDKWLDFIDQKN